VDQVIDVPTLAMVRECIESLLAARPSPAIPEKFAWMGYAPAGVPVKVSVVPAAPFTTITGPAVPTPGTVKVTVPPVNGPEVVMTVAAKVTVCAFGLKVALTEDAVVEVPLPSAQASIVNAAVELISVRKRGSGLTESAATTVLSGASPDWT
jgi:hypothetical protein